ncbi:MAG: hypothetical protein KBD31_03825 [Proteobacteria bacterium]|nr:hypothetical protein [Pseudomonadota bacterium]
MISVLTPVSYIEDLQTIGSATLSIKEVDVLACIINGHQNKTASRILNIDVSVFENVLINLKKAFSVHSKKAILTILNKYQKTELYHKYYHFLKLEHEFKECFKNYKVSLPLFKDVCIFYKDNDTLAKIYSLFLKRYFDFLKIKIDINPLSSNDLKIEEESIKNTSFLFLCFIDLENTSSKSYPILLNKTLKKDDLFSIDPNADFFENFIKILMLVTKDPHINILHETFQKKVKKTIKSVETKNSFFGPFFSFLQNQDVRLKKTRSKKNVKFNHSIVILLCSFLFLYTLFDFSKKNYVQENFCLPIASQLIKRSSLINQIDQIFLYQEKKLKNSISYCTLSGTEGSGKTTLIRVYAKKQKKNIVWEVDATSFETIYTSYLNLAFLLAKKNHEKDELELIQSIQDDTVRINNLLEFIQIKLKKNPDWLLIFNHVQSLEDIDLFLPKNDIIWGKGRILIATHKIYPHKIFKHRTVNIENLSLKDSLSLFCQIYYKKLPYQLPKEKLLEVTEFLKLLPNYPLDISLIAHFMHQTHLTFSDYITLMNQGNVSFQKIQNESLNDNILLSKMRIQIVITTLKKITSMDPYFSDILSCMIMNDKNTTRNDLIKKFKPEVVDSFIQTLKDFSLIIEYNNVTDDTLSTFYTLHPIVQKTLNTFFKVESIHL